MTDTKTTYLVEPLSFYIKNCMKEAYISLVLVLRFLGLH